MYDAFPLSAGFHRIIQKIRRNATAAAILERVEESQNLCGSEYSGVLRSTPGVLRSTPEYSRSTPGVFASTE